jgi:hypothetical protein
MERLHQIHRAFAGGNLLAAFGGLAYKETPIDLSVILLVVFLILLRAKFWYEDEAYLEDVAKGTLPGGLPFAFGMFMAVLSWIAWAFAGFFVKDIELCSKIMLIVLGLSTAWMVAAIVKRGSYVEQIPWLFFNCLYFLSFALLSSRAGWADEVGVNINSFTVNAIICIYFVLVPDFALTRVLEQKRRNPPPR